MITLDRRPTLRAAAVSPEAIVEACAESSFVARTAIVVGTLLGLAISYAVRASRVYPAEALRCQ